MNDNGAGALLAGGGVLIISLLISVVFLACWIWALVDAIKTPRLTDNERLIWIIVILVTGCLGAAIYLIVGRKK